MNLAFTTANLVDAVIAISVLEVGALMLYRRLTGRGIAPRDYLANMSSGLCLMGALHCLVADAGTAWVAGFLLAAGCAHFTDILARLRRSHRDATLSNGMTA